MSHTCEGWRSDPLLLLCTADGLPTAPVVHEPRRCSPSCRGWDPFDVETDPSIQRCDECHWRPGPVQHYTDDDALTDAAAWAREIIAMMAGVGPSPDGAVADDARLSVDHERGIDIANVLLALGSTDEGIEALHLAFVNPKPYRGPFAELEPTQAPSAVLRETPQSLMQRHDATAFRQDAARRRDEDPCDGCGCVAGDGVTAGCMDPDGCGRGRCRDCEGRGAVAVMGTLERPCELCGGSGDA